jgi:D-3-phosphoglycerate dehydrogenase
VKECQSGKFDGVVAAYRTFHSFGITGLIDQELVEAFPSSLRYLASCGMSTLDTWLFPEEMMLTRFQ